MHIYEATARVAIGFIYIGILVSVTCQLHSHYLYPFPVPKTYLFSSDGCYPYTDALVMQPSHGPAGQTTFCTWPCQEFGCRSHKIRFSCSNVYLVPLEGNLTALRLLFQKAVKRSVLYLPAHAGIHALIGTCTVYHNLSLTYTKISAKLLHAKEVTKYFRDQSPIF